MKMRRKIADLLLLSLFCAVGGCTKEDTVICGVDVAFLYDYNLDGVDKFAGSIDKVNLYVFDRSGLFVGNFPQQGPFSDDFKMRLDLPAGEYSFIAWGEKASDSEHYRISESDNRHIDGGTLTLVTRAGNDIVDRFPANLYHGQISTPVKALNSRVVIPMIKNTNSVSVKFNGLPISPETVERFSCRIESDNSDYDFRNRIKKESRHLIYLPEETTDFEEKNPVLAKNFVTMRVLADKGRGFNEESNERGCGSNLTLQYTHPSGQVLELLDRSLVELIGLQYTEEEMDYDRRDAFELEFDYEGDLNFANFTITINGWKVAESDGGTGGIIW